MLVGFDTSDDACVYRLSDQLAMVQTVDFFPPVVDDPYAFGQIAAANALSDVYAMGGRPALAMNLLCYPTCLEPEVVQAILAGGYDKVRESGAVIAGGHTIQDPEPKYGLCVTGFVSPDKVLANVGARPGDVLLLTKPLGVGVMVTAAKGELLEEQEMAPVINSMSTLNKAAAEALDGFEIHACTDVTGFGLLGHGLEMMEGSKVSARIQREALPVFPKAVELAEMGILPAGAYANRSYQEPRISFGSKVPLAWQDLMFDPQTSGGLLIAAAPEQAEKLLLRLQECCPWARLIGEVLPPQEKSIYVE